MKAPALPVAVPPFDVAAWWLSELADDPLSVDDAGLFARLAAREFSGETFDLLNALDRTELEMGSGDPVPVVAAMHDAVLDVALEFAQKTLALPDYAFDRLAPRVRGLTFDRLACIASALRDAPRHVSRFHATHAAAEPRQTQEIPR